MRKYAVEESHRYFQNAYDLLSQERMQTHEEKELLADLLCKWSLVFQYRGDSRGWTDLLSRHKAEVAALGDRVRLGMYYSQLGSALYQTEQVQDACQYLREGLALGEEAGDEGVIGYACAWLAWVCTELGLFREAIAFGERAKEIGLLTSEEQIFFLALGGMGLAYYYMGDRARGMESGEQLLKHGQKFGNLRSQVMGHFSIGCSHMVAGDFSSAVESLERATQIAVDPWYSQFPRLLLGLCLLSMSQFQEAKEALTKVFEHSQVYGADLVGTPARSLLAVVMITEGHLSKGLKILEDIQRHYISNRRRYVYAAGEHLIGRIHSQLATASHANFPLLKNLGFLLRNLPYCKRKAEEHLKRAIEAAEEIEAQCLAGMAYLDLGHLYQAMGKGDHSQDCFLKAKEHFGQCGTEVFLKQADERLRSVAEKP